MTVEFIDATMEHCKIIAENMRECDKNEVWASSHQEPLTALVESLKLSTYAQTATLDGVPCAMYGVGAKNVLDDWGAPWMLATDDLRLWGKQFLMRSIRVIREMLQFHPILFNFVDARNAASIQWLIWLGFDVSPQPEPWGMDGLPFHTFRKTRRDYRA